MHTNLWATPFSCNSFFFFFLVISFKLSCWGISSYELVCSILHQSLDPTRQQNVVYELQRIVPVIKSKQCNNWSIKCLESMCTHFFAVPWFIPSWTLILKNHLLNASPGTASLWGYSNSVLFIFYLHDINIVPCML